MLDIFKCLSPLIQVLIATFFTWFMTTLGASLVFFLKRINKTLMDSMLALAAGVMISSSFWSLLIPSIEKVEENGMNGMLIISCGFLLGGIILLISDICMSRLLNNRDAKSNTFEFKRAFMLISSVSVHNALEGLCIGVAFASLHINYSESALLGAIMLTIGIGIQNFPEGAAISLPLRRDKMSNSKAFILGSLSGAIEPVAGIIGFLLVRKVEESLPFLLSLAAGTMIYVVVSELIPESQTNENKKLISMVTLIGFTLMMILDIAFR